MPTLSCKEMGVEVYSGVSTDTHFVHKAWHDASDTIKKIDYPMLADPTGTLTRGFGVHIEEEGVALRAFVADPDGNIKVAEIHDLGIGQVPKSWFARSRLPSLLLNTQVVMLPC